MPTLPRLLILLCVPVSILFGVVAGTAFSLLLLAYLGLLHLQGRDPFRAAPRPSTLLVACTLMSLLGTAVVILDQHGSQSVDLDARTYLETLEHRAATLAQARQDGNRDTMVAALKQPGIPEVPAMVRPNLAAALLARGVLYVTPPDAWDPNYAFGLHRLIDLRRRAILETLHPSDALTLAHLQAQERDLVAFLTQLQRTPIPPPASVAAM